MDWNWFFSSLSQSSAAIVGIFGAFIITKVLSNQAVFGVKLERGRSLKATAEKLVASAKNLGFSWYIRNELDSEMKEAAEHLENEADIDPDVLYDKLDFPPFIRRNDVIKRLDVLKLEMERAKEWKRLQVEERARARAEKRAKSPFMFGLEESVGEIPQPYTPTFSTPVLGLEKERESIDALEVEIRHHMRTVSDYLETVVKNPESSRAIAGALAMVAALFILGVVYPLSFLPTPANWTPAIELQGFWTRPFSLRGFLLTAVTVLFLAALVMFGYLNWRLRYGSELVGSLDAFTRIGAYSEYYDIAEENARAAREVVLERQARLAQKELVSAVPPQTVARGRP